MTIDKAVALAPKERRYLWHVRADLRIVVQDKCSSVATRIFGWGFVQ